MNQIVTTIFHYLLSPSLPHSFSLSLFHRFFVVEDTVLHTSQTLVSHQASARGGEERDEGLVSRPIVHEFWSMASAEVLAVLRTTCVSFFFFFFFFSRFCHAIKFIQACVYFQNAAKDYHLLLKVKELVVWFCHTMRVSQ